MARELFVERKFKPHIMHIINEADAILTEFMAKGFTMTLRQLHYQFVARKVILFDGEPYQNTDKSYDRLGVTMSNARLAGLIDWSAMEDRHRSLERISRWDSPADIVEVIADQYQEDLWEGQKHRFEVWIEKDALSGVIANICEELRIDYFACRGYVSASAQYGAAKRFKHYRMAGQKPVVLHLGDHDPSGLDMTRENREKFALLTGMDVEVRRLALNYDQIEEHRPPPNPTKLTDSRDPKYVEEFGHSSWELDALNPEVIEDLIRQAVEPYIDQKKKKNAMASEQHGQRLLKRVSGIWDRVVVRLDELEADED